MVNHAVGGFLRNARNVLVAVSLTTAMAVAISPIVAHGAPQAGGGSGGSSEQQQRVNAIIDELDRLGEQMDQLAETYAQAQNDQEDLIIEIAATEVRIKEKETQLAGMQKDLRAVAMKSFVSGGISNSLSSILSSTNGLTDSVSKKYLTSVALNAGAGNTDALQALIDDIAKERSSLENQRKRAVRVADYAAERLNAAESLSTVYLQRQAEAEQQLGTLLKSERQRRETAALAAAQAEAAKFKGTKFVNIAPPSSRSGVAIRAALSQLGVRYVFGAKSPGNAFDCSGLTSYAWGVAGVGIPRTSRYQYAALPHIPIAAAQPGDLIFSYNPISHVGIYLGNGQMVQSPRTGDVVKISAVSWSKVVGVARPG
ncbi:MAG: NlpC/P60 family protein [Ilumatobacteraceae bacterium]